MLCLLSVALNALVEPLANDVGDDVPDEGCSDCHEKQRDHQIHLLSNDEKGTDGKIILAKNFRRGKDGGGLKKFSHCDKLRAVKKITGQ